MQSSFAVHATWIVECNSYLFKRCFWWWKIDLANFSRLSILFYVNVKRCVVNKNVLFPLVSDTWIYRLQLLYFVMQVEMNSCMIIYLYMDVISDTFIYLNMWGYYSYYRIVCYSDILLVPRAKKLRFYWHIQMKNFATAFFAPSLSIFFYPKYRRCCVFVCRRTYKNLLHTNTKYDYEDIQKVGESGILKRCSTKRLN